LSVWTQDEAGPFQTVPYEGYAWQPECEPKRQPHEYVRNGTAKLLTLFHPSDGQVWVKGVTSCANTVLHPWLQRELSAILTDLPGPPEDLTPETNRALWECWCAGLDNPLSLPDDLPQLRMLLIWDNLAGHKSESNPVRVGRKTGSTPGTLPPAAPRARWLRGLHAPPDTTPPAHHNRRMAIRVTNDPLAPSPERISSVLPAATQKLRITRGR